MFSRIYHLSSLLTLCSPLSSLLSFVFSHFFLQCLLSALFFLHTSLLSPLFSFLPPLSSVFSVLSSPFCLLYSFCTLLAPFLSLLSCLLSLLSCLWLSFLSFLYFLSSVFSFSSCLFCLISSLFVLSFNIFSSIKIFSPISLPNSLFFVSNQSPQFQWTASILKFLYVCHVSRSLWGAYAHYLSHPS